LKEFIFFELGMRKPEEHFQFDDKARVNTQNILLMIKTEIQMQPLHWDFKFEFTSRQRCGTTI
jgi:hypothetical protein